MNNKASCWAVFCFCCLLIAAPLHAADYGKCPLEQKHSFTVGDGWIDVSNGRDEQGHRLRLKIWGSIRIQVICESLDLEPENEIIVISRSGGSGAYYRVQVIDFVERGIVTHSHPSDGKPEVNNGKLMLGYLSPKQRQIPMHPPEFNQYIYRPNQGIVRADFDAKPM